MLYFNIPVTPKFPEEFHSDFNALMPSDAYMRQ